MLGVFLDRGSVDRGDLDLASLEQVLPQWRMHETTLGNEMVERLRGAAVAVTNKLCFTEPVFAQLPDLRLICVTATGYNNIDVDAARRRGITVCNVRAYATPSVVQHVFCLMLTLFTRLPDYTRAVREGRWQNTTQFCLMDYPIRELSGKVLGIIGYGELGRAVADVGRAFGMQVRVARHNGGPAQEGHMSLDELLRGADVLTIHCPLTPQTRGLIGAEELAKMKKEAIIINTARGGIVDEIALAHALSAGRLGGAGVDVLSEEPPLRGNALLDKTIPNLIVTPHVAWASIESRQRAIDQTARNIQAFLDGHPENAL